MQTDTDAAGTQAGADVEKTAVITGAASGIGKATAIEFARKRYNIVAVARSEEGLNELVPECEILGAVVLTQTADVADQDMMDTVARNAIDSFGSIDVWVNNAGVLLMGRFDEAPPALFRRVIETNLFGCVNGTRAALPYFKEQGQGTLINVASFVGETGQPYASAYSASKAGIIAFSDTLRMELKDMPGIHVCTVLPSSIDTPLFHNAANYTGRAVRPLKPVYRAEKVARKIVKLAGKPKRETIVGGFGRASVAMHMLAPALTEKMTARFADRGEFLDRAAESTDGNLFHPNENWTTISGGWISAGKGRALIRRPVFGLSALASAAGAFAWLFRRIYLRYV